MDRQEFLMHKGVKGMKWGRRKAVDSGSSSRNASPSKAVDVKAVDVKAKDRDAKILVMRNSAATLASIGAFVVARQAGASAVVAAASGVTMAVMLLPSRRSARDQDEEPK